MKKKSIFDLTKEERDEAKANPQFKYVELGSCWAKHEGNDGGFTLNWGAENLGFGQLAFYRKGSKIKCDTEHMSNEFIKKALAHFLEKEVEYVDR